MMECWSYYFKIKKFETINGINFKIVLILKHINLLFI